MFKTNNEFKDIVLPFAVFMILIMVIAFSLSCNRVLVVSPTAPVPTPTMCRGCP